MTEVRLPQYDSRGERSRARNKLAADIIPRIISAARLTRSALRFPVAGHCGVSRSIGRSIEAWMMMVCENGKGTEENGAVWSKRRAKTDRRNRWKRKRTRTRRVKVAPLNRESRGRWMGDRGIDVEGKVNRKGRTDSRGNCDKLQRKGKTNGKRSKIEGSGRKFLGSSWGWEKEDTFKKQRRNSLRNNAVILAFQILWNWNVSKVFAIICTSLYWLNNQPKKQLIINDRVWNASVFVNARLEASQNFLAWNNVPSESNLYTSTQISSDWK